MRQARQRLGDDGPVRRFLRPHYSLRTGAAPPDGRPHGRRRRSPVERRALAMPLPEPQGVRDVRSSSGFSNALRSSCRYSSPDSTPRPHPRPRRTRVLAAEPFDLLARLGERWSRTTLPGRISPTPIVRRLSDLAVQPLSRPSRASSCGRGRSSGGRPRVRTDAVDTAVTLDEPHRVPRQVVVDDVARLLEVHALGEHVGRDEDVEEVIVLPGGASVVRGAKPKSAASFPSRPPAAAASRPGRRRGGVAVDALARGTRRSSRRCRRSR